MIITNSQSQGPITTLVADDFSDGENGFLRDADKNREFEHIVTLPS